MNTVPYIAVSAFETEEQVSRVAEGLARQNWPRPQGHVPLLGFAVDRGTLEGRYPGSPRKVVDMETLNRLLAQVPVGAQASLHFDFSSSGPDPRGALYALMEGIFDHTRLHSVQLNGAQSGDFEAVRDQLWDPSLGIIAPLQRDVVEAGQVADFLEAVRGVASHVLIDLSGGRGEFVTSTTLETLLPQIAALKPEVGLAVAGGLSASNVREVLHIARSLVPGRPLSVEAESSVRSGNSLDPEAALGFYTASHEALLITN